MTFHSRIAHAMPSQRPMSLQSALHWAFVTEKARIDFDRYGAHEFDREGIDPIWRGMQMAKLGTRIDAGVGGKTCNAAMDAQMIADRVANLPITAIDADGKDFDGFALTERDRREMAVEIVRCASSGIDPDWGKHDRLQIVSVEMVWDYRARDFFGLVTDGGSKYVWTTKRGISREHNGEICPVVITGTGEHIRKKRWRYHAWYSAMLWLWGELRQPGLLERIEITDAMPEVSPWRVGK